MLQEVPHDKMGMDQAVDNIRVMPAALLRQLVFSVHLRRAAF
jgi:hypothetical protein